MRFATWNLRAADTVAKLSRLDPCPDVAVLCEVRKQAPPTKLDGTGPEWLWAGTLADRGLAIASWGPEVHAVTPSEGRTPGSYSVAAELSNGIGVLGIWSCPQEKSPAAKSYADEIHASLDAYETMLTSRPCIVAGDFNLDPGGETDRRYGITGRLADLGYHSAYHVHHGLAHGQENHPTYYHQFKQAAPFHIDLVFLPIELMATLRSVDVQAFDEWVAPDAKHRSDHVPVTVVLDL